MTLRVLHCIYDDPRNPWVGGGGAVRAFEIYRRLRREVSVTIATGNYPGARDEEVDGVRYRRLGARGPYTWSRLTYAAAATRLLERADYDAAVFDSSPYTPLALPGGRRVGVTVHHLSGSDGRARWGFAGGRIIGALERRRLRNVRFFSATSRATFAELRALVGDEAEIHPIPAGVPDHLFELQRRKSDSLLFFGRMDWWHKGLDTLLEAMAILVRDRPGLKLRMAGRGRDAGRVAKAVQTLGLGSNVDLLGAVDEGRRDELFAEAGMLLMPSRFEGFGMVAAEAMAAGVPVVAADVGSLGEVVDPPAGGVLVPGGDPGALARAVEALLRDPDELARLSRSARVSAGRFRWQQVADQHLEFLTAIRAGGPHGS